MPTRPGPAAALYGASAALDRRGRRRGPQAQPGDPFWRHVGHADGPAQLHVPIGQPGAALPGNRRPVPAQHGAGRGQPLAAHALHHPGGRSLPQGRGGGGAPAAAPLLHKQAAAVRALRRERSVLLRPLPGEVQRRAPRAPGGPRAVPAPPLGRDPHGRPQVPAEPAAAGRSRRAIGRPGRRRQAIGRGAQTQNPVNPPQNQPGTPAKCPQNTPINGATADHGGVSSPLTR
ncbi:hypothetical protein Q9966_016716 [Columba livia]|nr:hypothetical protein Q9966_016716 [Columba livia]